MDNDTTNLIIQLCTRAAMIMEDISTFVFQPQLHPEGLRAGVDELGVAIADVGRLISAAQVLTKR
jgi:hypothetical protein